MNFQQMTLPELEIERSRLIGEIDRLDVQLQARGENFQKTTNTPRALRQEIQEIIERLVENLLPNLYLPTLNALKNTFPDEPQLTDVEPETIKPANSSLWETIKNLFGSSGIIPNQNLERQRVLLRGVLWNLTTLPANNGKFQYLFLLLLQKKEELRAAEKIAETIESNSDETLLQRQNLIAQLQECENEIARRRRRQDETESDNYYRRRMQSISDKERQNTPIYYPADRDTSFDNDSFGAGSSTNDSGTYDNSGASTGSSDSGAQAGAGGDFSFGGGGDFAGGGAGGSWDNYS